MPSHRALAMLRGRNEDVLALEIEVDAEDPRPIKPVVRMIADAYAIGEKLPGDVWLMGDRRLDLAGQSSRCISRSI